MHNNGDDGTNSVMAHGKNRMANRCNERGGCGGCGGHIEISFMVYDFAIQTHSLRKWRSSTPPSSAVVVTKRSPRE